MNTLHFSIIINAPREKVWETMLGDATYQQWVAPFNPEGYDSRFDGSWEKGSAMKFLGINKETGKEEGGMYTEITDNIPNEFISIKHLGEIKADGSEVPWPNTGEEGFENYTLKDVGEGKTEVFIDMTGVPDEYLQQMNDVWPKALEKLKEISET